MLKPAPYSSTEVPTLLILYALAVAKEAETILEIGTHQGGSTAILAQALEACGGGVLHTIEVDPELIAAAKRVLADFDVPHVEIIYHHGPSTLVLPTLTARFDFAFVDGWHDPANVRQEIALLRPCMQPLGLIALHDVGANGKGPLGRVVAEAGGLPLALQCQGLGLIQC